MFESQTATFTLRGYTFHITTGFLFTMFLVVGGQGSDPLTILGLLLSATFLFLAHEAGHAFAFRAFGVRSFIVFHALGGTTYPTQPPNLRRWQEITVSAAGPALGFLAAALFGGLLMLVPPGAEFARLVYIFRVAMIYGVWINLFNLLPIYPMDGGRIMQEVFASAFPTTFVKHISILGLVVGGLILWYFASHGRIFGAIIMGQLIYVNWQRMMRS